MNGRAFTEDENTKNSCSKLYLKHFFMTFGERIALIRKQLKWSRAKKVGTSAPNRRPVLAR
jgi:hypothetical protein